jgi:hypothetical protein
VYLKLTVICIITTTELRLFYWRGTYGTKYAQKMIYSEICTKELRSEGNCNRRSEVARFGGQVMDPDGLGLGVNIRTICLHNEVEHRSTNGMN